MGLGATQDDIINDCTIGGSVLDHETSIVFHEDSKMPVADHIGVVVAEQQVTLCRVAAECKTQAKIMDL